MEAFQFRDCVLRPSLRQLLRDGVPLALGARAHDLLPQRVANAGRVVGRDELMRAVWGDDDATYLAGYKQSVDEQRRCMPAAQVFMIPGATHFSLLPASPAATTQALRGFFED
jgi:DNA-binding response OmpR family regulator